MITPLVSHVTSFASFLTCIGLYVTNLIRSVDKDKKKNNTRNKEPFFEYNEVIIKVEA